MSAKGVRRLASGQQTVFASDLLRLSETPQDPSVVRAVGPQGEVLGEGLFNPRSKLALRLMTRGDTPVDESLVGARLLDASRYREGITEGYEGYRVVHGDADGLSGLIVDKYDEVLVVQQNAAALTPFMPLILEVLKERYRPRGILARNDSSARALEGLPQAVELLEGEVAEDVPYREGEVVLFASPWTGQKTGAFLDQRENHVYAGERAFGRALDVFSYHGGFALQLAQRAESVLAIDSSAPALEHLRRAAKRNGLEVETRQGNAFELLRELAEQGARFDTIVLDPPAFAKGRDQVAKALAGYKEINLRAMKLLAEGGRLLTASCSYHVDDASFYGMLGEAAADAGRQMRLIERRGQARCHPEVLNLPETHYLKLASLEASGMHSAV